MKHAVIIGILTVLILALLFAIKAFAFVFVAIFQYGLLALGTACALYLWWTLSRKSKKKKQDENN